MATPADPVKNLLGGTPPPPPLPPLAQTGDGDAYAHARIDRLQAEVALMIATTTMTNLDYDTRDWRARQIVEHFQKCDAEERARFIERPAAETEVQDQG